MSNKDVIRVVVLQGFKDGSLADRLAAEGIPTELKRVGKVYDISKPLLSAMISSGFHFQIAYQGEVAEND